MKKQLILSLLFVFALAVMAPTIVNAMDNDVKIVKVDGDEKKVDTKKAETKTTGESANKAEATGACAGKSEAKCADAKKTSCCGTAKATSDTKSADCADKKAEKK